MLKYVICKITVQPEIEDLIFMCVQQHFLMFLIVLF